MPTPPFLLLDYIRCSCLYPGKLKIYLFVCVANECKRHVKIAYIVHKQSLFD